MKNKVFGAVVSWMMYESTESRKAGIGDNIRKGTNVEINDLLKNAGRNIIKIDKSTDTLGRGDFRWLNVIGRMG